MIETSGIIENQNALLNENTHRNMTSQSESVNTQTRVIENENGTETITTETRTIRGETGTETRVKETRVIESSGGSETKVTESVSNEPNDSFTITNGSAAGGLVSSGHPSDIIINGNENDSITCEDEEVPLTPDYDQDEADTKTVDDDDEETFEVSMGEEVICYHSMQPCYICKESALPMSEKEKNDLIADMITSPDIDLDNLEMTNDECVSEDEEEDEGEDEKDVEKVACAMGINSSTLELADGEEYLSQCCLALRECASLRLIHGPKELKELIERTISIHWPLGGRTILDTSSIWEFRLKGLPFWNSFSPQRALQVHLLICNILQDMEADGWEVQTSTDLSRSKDLSTFFLRRQAKKMGDNSDSRKMFSATLADKNKIHVVNAPKAVITQLKKVFSNNWNKGIAKVTKNKYGYIFTLNGEPWSDDKTISLQASSLVHRLVNSIGLLGWDVTTIARVKNYRDTIFFRQKRMKKFDDLVGCFLSMSFYGKNKLRLIHCSDPSLADEITNFINESWEPGLEGQRRYHGTIEYRLNGKPFWADSTDGIDSKLLICALLTRLQRKGWRIHNFISPTRSLENKGTLIFRKEPSSEVSPMCISFDDEDKIRLIGATEDVKCVLRTVLTQRLGVNGIIREGNFRGCWEFKLYGSPWTGASSDEGIRIRSLLCHILQKLTFKGWCVMTSFDVSSKIIKSDERHPQPMDAQSWYLCKKENIDNAVKLWKTSLSDRADIDTSKKARRETKIAARARENGQLKSESSLVEEDTESIIASPMLASPETGEEIEIEPGLCVVDEDVKPDFRIPDVRHSAPSPPDDIDGMETPQSSLTELIKDVKKDNDFKRLSSLATSNPVNDDKGSDISSISSNVTVIQTTECDKRIDFDEFCISEEVVKPVMSSIDCNSRSASSMYDTIDCKTISPVPSNHEEFELPEIMDDVISSLLTDPPCKSQDNGGL